MSPDEHHLAQRWLGADALKTGALTLVLLALSAAISYLLLGFLGVIVSTVMVLASTWIGGNGELMMRLMRARPLTDANAPGLVDVVDRLSRRARIPSPALYWLPNALPNAMAVETSDGAGALALTEGLLRRLAPEELEAVLAHEIAHIQHGDTQLKRWTTSASGAALNLVRAAVWVGFFYALLTGEGHGTWLVLVLLSWLLPVAFGVLQSAISRTREFAADTAAVSLTGNPAALASALQKLELPRFSLLGLLWGSGRTSGWLDSHPATLERIFRLRTLGGGFTPRASGLGNQVPLTRRTPVKLTVATRRGPLFWRVL